MSRPYRRLAVAISCVVGIPFIAPVVSAQPKYPQQQPPPSNTVYLDFVVPVTFRDLDPAIVEVMPNCEVLATPTEPLGKFNPKSRAVLGETRVQNMKMSTDGSYSVTLRERVEMVPWPSGSAATITCRVFGKSMNGQVGALNQSAYMVAPFKLAPGSTDRVSGQFTW